MADIEVVYLWKVKVQFQNGDFNSRYTATTKLIITTGTVSIQAAIRKAQMFLKENKADYRKAVIHGAEYDGIIDA